MKTLAVFGAALAISLGCAGTAWAQATSVTTTSTNAFSNQTTTTTTDAFGNQRTVKKRQNADGSESVTKSVSDAFGNRKSVTKRQNADGSESVISTKTKGRIN